MSAAAPRLSPQPWMQAPATRRLLAALQEGERGNRVVARFVGGCVRDALAGRPVKDLDLATPLPPEEVMRRLAAAGLGMAPTGLKHGTVTAIVEHRPFEITTLRRDLETDGRHAVVAFTDDWQADAARRDLTINALFADPAGEVLDFFGGVADLAAGRVRFVGEARWRIEEDYLRLLRFFRFHAYFGRGAPDAEGLAAAAALAPRLAQISGERKRDELLKLLAAPDPLPVLAAMRSAGVLAQVLPTDAAGAARLQRLLQRLPAAPALARLAALLPEEPAAAEQCATALRLSNEDRKTLLFLCDSASGAALVGDSLAFRRTLQARGRELVKLRLALLEPLPAAAWAEAEGWAPAALPLKGADLLASGFPPGPSLGALLQALEDWWLLQDRRPDRAALLAKARELAP